MNPLDEIGEVVKKYDDIVFIVDAVSSAAGSKIEVDKWGIDICVTSSQKALGLSARNIFMHFFTKRLKREQKRLKIGELI